MITDLRFHFLDVLKHFRKVELVKLQAGLQVLFLLFQTHGVSLEVLCLFHRCCHLGHFCTCFVESFVFVQFFFLLLNHGYFLDEIRNVLPGVLAFFSQVLFSLHEQFSFV